MVSTYTHHHIFQCMLFTSVQHNNNFLFPKHTSAAVATITNGVCIAPAQCALPT